jgi:hypothetical protein
MISIHDVQKIERTRRSIKKEIYTKIYEQFSRKIRNSVELGQYNVTLTVPPLVIGYPTFDRSRAAVYLRRQLENGGFKVSQTDQFNLFVDWKIRSSTQKQLPQAPKSDELPSLMNLKKLAEKHRSA